MITGQITKILTQKENDWGRYELTLPDKRKLIAVGVINGVAIGMTVVLEGNEEDTKYGHQFSITSVLSSELDDFSGVRSFLLHGYIKGIGSVKAENIISAYGKKSLDLFDTEEGRNLLLKVKGISKLTLATMLESYNETKKYKDIVLFLDGQGTRNQIEKIYELYGDEAISVLKKNPYRLQTELDGFGFKKTDKMAISSGIKPNSIYRLMAAIKYLLDEASAGKGHCYLDFDEIKKQIYPLLTPCPKLNIEAGDIAIENALLDWDNKKENFIMKYEVPAKTVEELETLVETRRLISESLQEALEQALSEGFLLKVGEHIYTKKMYQTERETAESIAEMIKAGPVRFINDNILEKAIKDVESRKTSELKKIDPNNEFKITEEQEAAVRIAAKNRICVISGGPGRGKTAISEIVAHSFLLAGKSYNKEDILMLAPTGRAAQRISESTGYSSMTVHRAVAKIQKTGNFPIGKLILVDESSMCDIFLMKNILKIAKDCNLIIVGDVDQIASVGPGKVLRDIIDSGKVPYILLKQGHRNSGTIAKNAELINKGKKLEDYSYDEHFVYIPSSAEKITDVVISDYLKKLKEYNIKDIMLCAAMKDRGRASVSNLNRILQNTLTSKNPKADFGKGIVYYVGDRVMQLKNNYDFLKKYPDGSIQSGVFNGERGTVIGVYPDPENDSVKIAVEFDDGSKGGYTKNAIHELTLAYATTLHKCQGSEAALMMMVYTYADYMLLNRSLFYTGETRAKKEFRAYGEEQFKYGKMLSAFDIAVKKIDDSKRNTMLKEMLMELIK